MRSDAKTKFAGQQSMSPSPWLARSLNRVLSRWGELGCEVLLERSLFANLPAANPAIEVTLRLAGADDIDRISRLYSADPWLYLGSGPPTPENHAKACELYLDRLRRGELCFLAMSGEEIAHVNWICFAWGDALPGYPIRLRDGEVFTSDALTPAPFRGRGLHAFVLREMLAHAQTHGYRQAYTLWRIDRTASYKGLSQLGWTKCGFVMYFLPDGGTKPWFLWRRGNLEPLFRSA